LKNPPQIKTISPTKTEFSEKNKNFTFTDFGEKYNIKVEKVEKIEEDENIENLG